MGLLVISSITNTREPLVRKGELGSWCPGSPYTGVGVGLYGLWFIWFMVYMVYGLMVFDN